MMGDGTMRALTSASIGLGAAGVVAGGIGGYIQGQGDPKQGDRVVVPGLVLGIASGVVAGADLIRSGGSSNAFAARYFGAIAGVGIAAIAAREIAERT